MKILIIEDEKDLCSSLKTNLESECFAVDTANDGNDGLYLASINDYDIMLIDIVLPKKSGLDICKEIRRTKKTTPIIIISVKSEIDSKVELLNSGADDYVTKPFSFQELLARIKAILRRPNNIETKMLKIDDLILDPQKQSVKRGSSEIYLTRKEFMLLEYLMKNQSVVLSRASIMEHVWDRNADPFSNTIESHVLNLRRKIDLEGKKKLIYTIPGRGYKIDTKK